ncbi:MAG: hypothetical protein WCS30_09405 [Selenomonadaceae bacterium]
MQSDKAVAEIGRWRVVFNKQNFCDGLDLLLSIKLKYYVDVKTPNNDHEQTAQCITR